jgi:hypothetical protein
MGDVSYCDSHGGTGHSCNKGASDPDLLKGLPLTFNKGQLFPAQFDGWHVGVQFEQRSKRLAGPFWAKYSSFRKLLIRTHPQEGGPGSLGKGAPCRQAAVMFPKASSNCKTVNLTGNFPCCVHRRLL